MTQTVFLTNQQIATIKCAMLFYRGMLDVSAPDIMDEIDPEDREATKAAIDDAWGAMQGLEPELMEEGEPMGV